jgi:16S rRNA (adenine1518-N6/adenine1519-N6)-dimethyltransferase
MKLSEMKQALAADGIQLTKSLGQNFLHDGNQLRRIVDTAEVTRQDRILEIGPGLGPLTEMLVAQAGEVLAIEKDARLIAVLRDRFTSTVPVPSPAALQMERGRPPHLQLIHDDALAFLKREPRDWSDWKLVANLPYSVASPILVELAQSARPPRRMVVTLQIEVANRLMALPGDKDYGILTLMIQLHYEPQSWFKIPASCFFPKPEVDSACVCLTRRTEPLLPHEQCDALARIVKRSFSQRRKMMLKLLKADWGPDELENAFQLVALPRETRAETVGLEKFVGLTLVLNGET